MSLNKLFILGITLLLIMPLSLKATDSSTVRIITDVDNITILLNNDSLEFDSFGNKLTADKWFILNLPVGMYSFNFKHPSYPTKDTSFVLIKDSLVTIKLNYKELSLITNPDTNLNNSDSLVFISIRSTPSNANIMIDGDQIDNTTPYQLYIDTGFHEFLVVSDGWEPLIYSFHYEGLSQVDLDFILKPLPPPKVVPESLGMEFMIEHPLIDIKKADNIKKKYSNLAEMFLIVPLSQGIIMKAIVDDGDKGTADILIGSGVLLTGGSYLLGKILSSRKRKQIVEQNESLTAVNNEIKTHNNELEKEIRKLDREAYQKWLEENTDKGLVKVSTK